METNPKRRLTLDLQIEVRKADIIKAAIHEFIENGIDNSKISDIAKQAGVGAVTVYRYFENKPKLVIECALTLWNSEMNKLEPQLYPADYIDLNGFEQVKHILNTIGSLPEICPHLLRLLEQFDNYIVKEQIPKEQLQQYESSILSTREILLDAVHKGQQDGSIRSDIDALQIYATATHALVALSQKLLLRGDVILSDKEIAAKTQIALLIDMELNYIKAKKEVR